MPAIPSIIPLKIAPAGRRVRGLNENSIPRGSARNPSPSNSKLCSRSSWAYKINSFDSVVKNFPIESGKIKVLTSLDSLNSTFILSKSIDSKAKNHL